MFHEGDHTRISPVYRGLLHFAQENLTLLHLPADTCQNSHSPLPHILNTELSHLWLTSLFALCSCVVSLISKTIQVLQLQMTTVITVSNSAASVNPGKSFMLLNPHRNAPEQSCMWDKLFNCINPREHSCHEGNETHLNGHSHK